MKWDVPLLFALVPGWCAAVENRTSALLSSLSTYPRSCLSDAIPNSVCDSSNATCICTEEKLLLEAALCIFEGCSVGDYLTSINGTNAYCGAPIRDKTQLFINVTIVLGVISALFVLLRISSKVFLTKSDFGHLGKNPSWCQIMASK
ncbi:hypothetical protein QQZ08_002070 [Neonectria magnoliae]|uniref:CFEM domain-containing protein n=1 Tax=Neonectria magnoliae TaxID=2732573 RepID=A0ABR1IE69_9HYPO